MGVINKLFPFLVNGWLAMATSTTSIIGTYRKVNSDFPDGMTNCLLEKQYFPPSVNLWLHCATACNQIANCRLFCTKGNECWLFNTFVTGEYVGAMGGGSFGFASCYTSWFFRHNVGHQAIVSISSPYHAFINLNSELWSTNGYFCSKYNECTITNAAYRPWYLADLQTQYEVSTILVKPRDDGYDFWNIEIRFGNSPTFSDNPVFASHPGPTPSAGTVLTFQAKRPMLGRYLSFQSLEDYAAVAICEVQILTTKNL